jgi:hypothetical protein
MSQFSKSSSIQQMMRIENSGSPLDSAKNVRLMGTEIAKTAESAIECPRNLFSTFFDHGLGVPKYGPLLLISKNLAAPTSC